MTAPQAVSTESTHRPENQTRDLVFPRETIDPAILSSLPLPRITNDAMTCARALSKPLREALKEHLRQRAGDEEGAPLRRGSRKVHDLTMQDLFRKVLESAGFADPRVTGDDTLYTLTAFLTVRTVSNPRGVVTALPQGFLSDGPERLSRLRTLAVYFFTEHLKLQTFRDLEQLSSWADKMRAAGLSCLGSFSPLELAELAFPGCTDGQAGRRPLVRDWALPGTNKWHLAHPADEAALQSRIRRAVRSVLQDLRVFRSDGTVDEGVLCNTNWGIVLNRAIRGLIGHGTYISSALEALDLALPRVIGTKKGQIPPWRAMKVSTFTPELVDAVTDFLVFQKLKLTDDQGRPSVAKIRAVPDWRSQYQRECGKGLSCLPVPTAYAALKRRFPDLFGWSDQLIKPGDIRFNGMWDGPAGQRLFAQRFAWSLVDAYRKAFPGDPHPPRFSPRDETPWRGTAEHLRRLRAWYWERGENWTSHLARYQLAAGIRLAAGRTVEGAFSLALGALEGKSDAARFGRSGVSLRDLGLGEKDVARVEYFLIIPSSSRPAARELTFRKREVSGGYRQGNMLDDLLAPRPPTKTLHLLPLLVGAFEIVLHRDGLQFSQDEKTRYLKRSALGTLLLAVRRHEETGGASRSRELPSAVERCSA